MAKPRFCPHCQAVLREYDPTCATCGLPLPARFLRPSLRTRMAEKPRGILLAGGALVLLVVAVVLLAATFRHPSGPPPAPVVDSVVVTSIQLAAQGDNTCLVFPAPTLQGYSAPAGSEEPLSFQISEDSTIFACVVQNVTVSPTQFSVGASDLPLCVPLGGGTQTLSLDLLDPSPAYSGNLSLTFGWLESSHVSC